MFGFKQICAAALAAVLALSSPALAARQDTGSFDLEIRGINVGVLVFNGTSDTASYAVAGRLESTGLAAFVRKVRYDASVTGRLSGGKFVPSQYSEVADTGKRQSESVMEYRSGVPQVKKYAPPRDPSPTDIDPATQGGTLDPLTALFATLRDVPVADACKLSVYMFDGKRRSSIALAAAEVDGETITCAGEYRRLEGFSAKEMAEKQRFPFRLTYAPADAGFVRVVSVSMDSLYGRASLTRR